MKIIKVVLFFVLYLGIGVVYATPMPQDTTQKQAFLRAWEENGKFFLEIPEKTLGRDILSTITIINASAVDIRSSSSRFGYGGDSVFDKLFRLIKNGNKIEIHNPNIFANINPDNVYSKYFESVKERESVIYSLDIKETKDGGSFVIDITDLYCGDNNIFSLSGVSGELKLGSYVKESFRNIDIASFDSNINFKSVRSYGMAPQNAAPAAAPAPQPRAASAAQAPSQNASLWEVGASWLLLPEEPMKPRKIEPRVGYFRTYLKGVDGENGIIETFEFANRWRLEPKPEDVEKYLRGELVEPKKPIVFYISRTAPEFLVPYMIDAVNVWQGVFEKAGFRNAIVAKRAPTQEEDPEYSEDDVRYSLISYKASPIPNAYGPMITDPRSGEVITAHIGIYHSILDLIQRWYFVMCSAVDPSARKYPLDEDFLGDMAALVLTHEVGHSLGLLHDFAGSTAYTTEQLRDKDFIKQNGLGASIMDYQRFNYVAQPGDGLTRNELIPRLGVYDDYAIEWGYRWFPDTVGYDEQTETLSKWVTNKVAEDPRLFFLRENNMYDPRIQSEDYAKDGVAANRLALRNLRETVDNLEAWTDPADDPDGSVVRRRYTACLGQYQNYIKHVLGYIAGRYDDNQELDENKVLFKPVPRAQQLEALEFMRDYFFTEPTWLYPRNFMTKNGLDYKTYVHYPSVKTIGILILKKVFISQTVGVEDDALAYDEMIDLIYDWVFGNKNPEQEVSQYDRTIQSILVTQMVINADNAVAQTSGMALKLKLKLGDIKNYAADAAEKVTDDISKAHYGAIVSLITIWEQDNMNLLKHLSL